MPKKELYYLAVEFNNTKLWQRLFDTELFAVRMTDGEIGYVSVMGALGKHLALAVYMGIAGLDSYRLLGQAQKRQSELERTERMMSQDCIMCSFENKADLRERDLKEINGHGLMLRGKKAYPMFQRVRPHFMPWYLEDGQDEEYLRRGLLAGLEVARKLKGAAVQQDIFHAPEPGASKEKLGFTEGAPFDREIPILSPKADGTFEWGRILLPEPAVPVFPSPKLTDDIAVMKLKKPKKRGVWECEMIMLPEPTATGETDEDGFVLEPRNAPYFPYMLLMVDHADGMVLHFGMAGEPEDYAKDLMDAFVKGMMKNGVPEEVLVREERTRALLSGIAEQTGIRVTLEDDLPFLDEAEESLVQTIGSGKAPDADIEATLNDLMDKADLDDLPDEMKRQLMELTQRDDVLSAATMNKLNRFLAGGKTAPSGKTAARPQNKGKKHSQESFLVSVSLETGCYRHIRISAGDTLFDLHKAILDAFGFEDDHAHAFFMDNRVWSNADSYFSKGMEGSKRLTKSYTLSAAGLCPGKQFKYVYDFGDEWTFQCKVLKMLNEATDAPQIVRSVGSAPPQYGGADDEDEEEEQWILPEIYPQQTLTKMYKALRLPKETVQLLHQYFNAFAHLYGILPLRKALEIYNKQNLPVDEKDFIEFAEIARHEEHGYFILGEDDLYVNVQKPPTPLDREIVEESLAMDDDDYEEMKAGQEGKPYYIPGKQVLLRYADSNYFEKNAEFMALRDFLRDQMMLPQDRADDIADELQLHACMAESDMNYIMNDLQRMGLTFAKIEDVQAFMTLYANMANNTRIPVNRGYTPSEIFKKYGPPRPIRPGSGTSETARRGNMDTGEMRISRPREADGIKSEADTKGQPSNAPGEKINRNALCPCGSGKKYKHCCGKGS